MKKIITYDEKKVSPVDTALEPVEDVGVAAEELLSDGELGHHLVHPTPVVQTQLVVPGSRHIDGVHQVPARQKLHT